MSEKLFRLVKSYSGNSYSCGYSYGDSHSNGYGYGSGYGNCYGDGCGDGCGNGYGDGYGDGYGSGYRTIQIRRKLKYEKNLPNFLIGLNYINTNILTGSGNPALWGKTPHDIHVALENYIKQKLPEWGFNFIGPWSNIKVGPWADIISDLENPINFLDPFPGKRIYIEIKNYEKDSKNLGFFLGNEHIWVSKLSFNDAYVYLNTFHQKLLVNQIPTNKIIFGHRFAGILRLKFGLKNFTKLLEITSEGVDILCINAYNLFTPQELNDIGRSLNKPILITEFSFHANDFENQRIKNKQGRYKNNTYPQTKNQLTREKNYYDYITAMADQPNIIGVCWHGFADMGSVSNRWLDILFRKRYKNISNWGLVDFWKQKETKGNFFEYKEFITGVIRGNREALNRRSI